MYVYNIYVLKARRCLYYHDTRSTNHLLKELNQPHADGWSVVKFPEWLLFELEQNICIRSIQAKIASMIIDSSKVHFII